MQDDFTDTLRKSVRKNLAEFKEQHRILKFLELKGLVEAQRNLGIRSWLLHDGDRTTRKVDAVDCNLKVVLNVAIEHEDETMQRTIQSIESLKPHFAGYSKPDEAFEPLLELYGDMNASLLSKRRTLVYVGNCSQSANPCDYYGMKKTLGGCEALWSYACFGHVNDAHTAFSILKHLRQGSVMRDSANVPSGVPCTLLSFMPNGRKVCYAVNDSEITAGGPGTDRLHKDRSLKLKSKGKECQAARGQSATHIFVKFGNGREELAPLYDLVVLETSQPCGPMRYKRGHDFYKISGQYVQRGTPLKDNSSKACQVWNAASATEVIVRYADGSKRRVPVCQLTLVKSTVELDVKALEMEYDSQLRKIEDMCPNYVLDLEKDTFMEECAEQYGCCTGLNIFSPSDSQKVVDGNYLLHGYGSEIDIAQLFQIAREQNIDDVLFLGCKEAVLKSGKEFICGTCGQECPLGAKFCSACGSPLGTDSSHSCKNFEMCRNFADGVTMPRKRLRDLTAQAQQVDFWDPLNELHNLKALNIGDANGIGAGACRHIQKLSTLVQLSIGDHNEILDEGCKALSEIKSLTSVDIGLNKIGTAGCDYLTELPQLANLQIGKMNDLGPDAFENFMKFQKLINLSIGGYNDVGVIGCSHLTHVVSLRSLTIGKRNLVGKEGCEHLKALMQLETLKVGGFNNIGPEGCEHLKEMKLLTMLRIGGHNKVIDHGLQHLKELEPSTSVSVRAKANEFGEEDYGPYKLDEEDDDGDDDEDVEEEEEEQILVIEKNKDLYSSSDEEA